MAAQHGQSASPFVMIYLAPILLVLVIQATFVVTHSTAVPNDTYALVLRMDSETPFGLPPMYIEVHPCAKFFDAERSLWYKTDGVPYSYEKCKGMKHAAAWRSTEQRSGGVECMPMGGDLPVGLKPDQRHCFTFQQPKDGPKDSAAWAHPCETRIAMMPQFLTVSIWYTAWYHMSFENCHKKPNAGAWTRTRKLGSSDCFVIPDPSSPDDKKLLGTCFVLDRVPVGLSYVEVHPCDQYFRIDKTKFFSRIAYERADHTLSTVFNLKKCREQKDAVAWIDPPDTAPSRCVPIPSKIEEAGTTEGGECLRFNMTELPRLPKAAADKSASGYKHVCEEQFKADTSKWYTRLDGFLGFLKCSQQEDAVAWRGTLMGKPCFVFDQGRNKDPNGRPELQGPGICYVRRNNVVPLHSFLPHWLAHDDLPIGHGVDLETRDGAGLGSLETYTYGHPYDVGF